MKFYWNTLVKMLQESDTISLFCSSESLEGDEIMAIHAPKGLSIEGCAVLSYVSSYYV